MDTADTTAALRHRLEEAIRTIETAVGNPGGGLPLDVFLFVTRLVPLFTVDLWIQDARGRTLLTWRDDSYFGTGWHVPGGAVRYKETIHDRLIACAREELGAEITYDPVPMAILEEIDPVRRTRGHNVAAAYRCTLTAGPDPRRAYEGGAPQPGQWAWHATCPTNLLPVHRVYQSYFRRQ
jgi:colanic acid biosynthesis protein WcaH